MSKSGKNLPRCVNFVTLRGKTPGFSPNHYFFEYVKLFLWQLWYWPNSHKKHSHQKISSIEMKSFQSERQQKSWLLFDPQPRTKSKILGIFKLDFFDKMFFFDFFCEYFFTFSKGGRTPITALSSKFLWKQKFRGNWSDLTFRIVILEEKNFWDRIFCTCGVRPRYP